MRMVAGIVVLVAMVGLTTDASAKHRRRHIQVSTPVVVAPACRPLCNTDMSPCDPPEFKRVDGRCDMGPYGNGAGGFR